MDHGGRTAAGYLTMNPGHYFTHCMEEVWQQAVEHFPLKEREVLGALIQAGAEAEKFILPKDGFDIDLVKDPEVLNKMRLPFTKCVLEYDITPKLGRSSIPEYAHINTFTERVVLHLEEMNTTNHGDGFIVQAFMYTNCAHPGWKRWWLIPVTLFIPYSGDIRVVGEDKIAVPVQTVSPFPELVKRVMAQNGVVDEQAFADRYITLLSDEVTRIMGFINVLSCSNVVKEVIEAPAKLNRKRAMGKKGAGKLPFFEYRVLKVRGRGDGAGASNPGGHASPRQHVRRGHIRRYQSGKTLWIASMVVGDPTRGKITKDYVF
jgi:hypothetical protein